MHLGYNFQSTPESVKATEVVLGGHHPLVVALERRVVATRQMLAVLVVLVLSVLAMLGGATAALPVALAGCGVALVMGWRLVLRTSEFRERVWELAISGRDEFLLASVKRERSRLLDPAVRAELARAYGSLGAEPDASGRVPARACVIVVPSGMARVQPELRSSRRCSVTTKRRFAGSRRRRSCSAMAPRRCSGVMMWSYPRTCTGSRTCSATQAAVPLRG